MLMLLKAHRTVRKTSNPHIQGILRAEQQQLALHQM